MISSVYAEEYRYIQILVIGYDSDYYKFVVPELEHEISCERQYRNFPLCLTECQLKLNKYLEINPHTNLNGFYYRGKKVLIKYSASGRGLHFVVVGYDNIFDSAENFRSEASVRRAAEMAIDAYEIYRIGEE